MRYNTLIFKIAENKHREMSLNPWIWITELLNAVVQDLVSHDNIRL